MTNDPTHTQSLTTHKRLTDTPTNKERPMPKNKSKPDWQFTFTISGQSRHVQTTTIPERRWL